MMLMKAKEWNSLDKTEKRMLIVASAMNSYGATVRRALKKTMLSGN